MQASNTQEINAEGALLIHGIIPQYPGEALAVSDNSGTTETATNVQATAFWLRKSIHAINQIQALHTSLTDDDGHLIGVERFELIAALDHGLNHFVQLRRVLDGKIDLTASHPRYDFRLLINVRGETWRGQGQVGRYQNINTSAFRLWLSRLRTERLPAVIKFLGQALADGVLDERERLILDRSIDRMIFGFILVRENVATGRLG